MSNEIVVEGPDYLQVDVEPVIANVTVEIAGPPGPQGVQGDVSVGGTVTLPPGASAYVTDSDPSPHKSILQFGLVTGPKGDKGDTGPNGITVQGTLNDLTDVDTAGVANGQTIIFRSSDSKFIPGTPVDLASLEALFVNTAGDNLTGYHKYQSPGTMGFNAATPANQNIEFLVADKLRWTIGRTSTAEAGANAGSNLSISAWSDAGTFLFNALIFDRATGLVTVRADPTAATGIATKNYVDTNTQKRTVLQASGTISASAAAKTDYIYYAAAYATVNMPTAVGNANRYTFKRLGSEDVIVNALGGETIDGTPSYVLDVQFMSIDLVSFGTGWMVI